MDHTSRRGSGEKAGAIAAGVLLAAAAAGYLRIMGSDALRAREPGPVQVSLESASSSSKAGDLEAARAALERTEGMKPSADELRWAAELREDIGDHQRAYELFGSLLEESPDDPALWIGRAEAARGLGDRKGSMESLNRASALARSPEVMHRIALVHMAWKDYAKAAAILRGVAAEADVRTAAAALKDKGVCEFLRGSPSLAVKDLEEALRNDDGLLSAYASLGAVLTSQKRFRRARSVYERALEAAPRKGEEDLRAGIRKSLERLQAEAAGGKR